MRAYEINSQQWRVDVAMPDGSRAQTVVQAQTKQQASEQAKRYYRGKNLRVRVVSVEPESIEEKINPQTVQPGFRREKRLDANIRLVAQARAEQNKDGTYGLIIRAYDDSHRGAWPEIGMARMILSTNDLDDPENYMSASFLHVDTDYRRRGIASAMYNWARELGNEVRASDTLSYAGQQFWKAGGGQGRGYKRPLALPKPAEAPKPAAKPGLWQRFRQSLAEVNAEDELSVSQQIQDYFTSRGYKYLGEGRDQIAFLSPRNTVVKVLGIGEDEREKVVRDYVAYFQANQKNPYYPRIYNSGEFTLDGETYFVYEMEYLQYVANEEKTLDFLETLMWKLSTGGVEEFLDKNLIPSELTDAEVYGLIETTENLLKYLGKTINAPLDLHNVENLRRRSNGHLVITDPFSL